MGYERTQLPEIQSEDWRTRRRRRLIAGLDLTTTRGIEIGPLAAPLVGKAESDVRYVDYADQATLQARYANDPNVDVAAIVPVDVLWGSRTLRECFPNEAGFDYVVASHVLEHVPDIVGSLQEFASVLRPGGRLYLAIPDRRFTFDYMRRVSSLGEVVDAFIRRSRRPTPAQVFDQVAYGTDVDVFSAWSGAIDRAVLGRAPKLRPALELATRAAEPGEYTDVHCWVFTPLSLLEILIALVDLELLPYRCASFHEPQPYELEMLLALEKADTTDPVINAEARASLLAHRERLQPAGGGVPSLAPSPPRRGVWNRLRRVVALRDREPHATFAADVRLIVRPCPIPEASQLGRAYPPYRRTFDFAGEFIDPGHRAIAELPVENELVHAAVSGFLRPADALVLYELAYFATSDVLELGSAWGLSTTILCQAVRNAVRGVRIASIEQEPAFQQATAEAVRARDLERFYDPLPGNSTTVIERLIAGGRTFSVLFVDHDHTYDGMRPTCSRIAALLRPGGLALFHDFNDPRNVTEPQSYGTYQAVCELLEDGRMTFVGVIGCCGLVYRSAA